MPVPYKSENLISHRNEFWITRIVFQRALAFIYATAFLVAIQQFVPLLGSNGLLPVSLFLKRITFWQVPSIFWFNPSDSFLVAAAWVGLILSLTALSGISERFSGWISSFVWGLLWLLYLSFVNVGQTFYGFGWESILLEAGFLAIFLGSRKMHPPKIMIWLIRWILFRIMLGAGLIKIRADECWRDLTCMMYHYETQPVPNPLSSFFHFLPAWFHKVEVLFTHFVELIVPWGYLLTRRIVLVCGIFTIIFHIALILSGNLSWLNYLTITLALSCFDDQFLAKLFRLKIPESFQISVVRKAMIWTLFTVMLFLSVNPVINMISPKQIMNATFNPFHLVNAYGAFGGITRTRREIILEGTSDAELKPESEWKAYEFKCKPGDPSSRPCIVSPYHYRLDWQMWFAAMSDYRHHPWILNLMAKLLKGNQPVASLFKQNPFLGAPPAYIRAELYEYRFATAEERRKNKMWWVRKRIGEYLPPLSLKQPAFRAILQKLEWME